MWAMARDCPSRAMARTAPRVQRGPLQRHLALISHPFAGTEVCVRESENKTLRFSPPYGGRVWDSGLVLSSWLEDRHGDWLQGKRVLELGAGVGLLGLCCAHLGAEVTITDGAESLTELMQRNVARNRVAIEARGGSARVAMLEWGSGEDILAVSRHGPFDAIVGSDLCYDTHIHSFLADTIDALAGPRTSVLLASPITRLLHRGRVDGGRLQQIIDAVADAQEAASHVNLAPEPDTSFTRFGYLLRERGFSQEEMFAQEGGEGGVNRTADVVEIQRWARFQPS
jgi:predicted nicotinamide N-methyase